MAAALTLAFFFLLLFATTKAAVSQIDLSKGRSIPDRRAAKDRTCVAPVSDSAGRKQIAV
jgi:hypothetical protein